MKKLYGLLLLGCTLTLQSCFEIVEQLFVKSNGSGTFQLVLNLSKSKTRINSIIQMKTVNGHPVPTRPEIRQKVADIETAVKKTKGISNVSSNIDFDNYILTLNCSFNHVDNLNEAVKNIGGQAVKQPGFEKNYAYDATSGTFSRLNHFSLKDEYQKLSTADREVFATAIYTSIFRFENNVAASSNGDSKMSANKKAVMLKLNTLDIINNKKSIANKITLLK